MVVNFRTHEISRGTHKLTGHQKKKKDMIYSDLMNSFIYFFYNYNNRYHSNFF